MVLGYWVRVALVGLLALASGPSVAALFTITANTNWDAIAGGPPTAADTIIVKGGVTLTVNVTDAVAGAITLGGAAPSAGQGTLSFSANTSALTISTASGQAGTLTLGSGGQAGNLNMANGGTLTLERFVSSTVGTFTRSATGTVGTVALRGTNTLPTAAAYNTFNNLRIEANTTTQAQALTIAGDLEVDGTLALNNTTTISGTTAIDGTLNITSATGVKTFTGAVTINGTWSNTVAGNVFIRSNLTNNGTFTSGTGNYTFNGTAAQTLAGSAGTTSFAIFILNNSNGLTLSNHNLTVTTLLTLSAGKITTGANVVFVSNGSAISAGTGRFIEGNLKKPFASGSLTRAFEVGGNSGSNYSPVSITFSSVTTAGNVIVSSTAGSHPQLASSGLDTATPAKLNRWWTITNDPTSPVAPTTFAATFTYVAAEIDAGASAAAFAASRYDGTDWDPTTLSATPTTTGLTISAETAFGDFAIGEVLEYNINRGSVGRFNAYDPPPVTPTNSVQGFIRTKTAGTAFTLRIVHMDTTGLVLQNVNKDSIRVELVDASNTGGTYTNNCSNAWTVIATVNTAFPSNTNQLDVTFSAALVANSYPSVRVKVTRTSGGTDTGCSGDRFAIRPDELVVAATDGDWQTAGTARTLNTSLGTGGVVHAASTSSAALPRPFTLSATARNAATPTPATTTNYSGTPTAVSAFPACVLPAGCTTGTLSFGSWSASAGVVSANAHYSEVGTFNLQLEDRTFANVDRVDTPAATRTIPSAATVLIGRFVPDHFTFTTANAPVLRTFGSSCASRSFTYVGQTFWFVDDTQRPSATLEARNAGDGVTQNYQGALFKLTSASITQTYSNNAVGPALNCKLSDLSADCSPTNAAAAVLTPLSAPDAGKATYSAPASGAAVLFYTRSTTGTPPSPYNANISLTVVATDGSESSGVVGNPGNGATPILTTSPSLVFSNISFDGGDFNVASALTGGKTFVYGRLRMINAFGSHTVALPVGIETQYWNGSAFQLNSADSCTTLAKANIRLGDYRPNLNACETEVTQGTVAFTGGSGLLYLKAPGAAALTNAGTPVAGSVLLTAQLVTSTPATDKYCNGVAETATTPADKGYLQGAWTGSTYTEDPSARATFGFYGAQPRNFIYFRENY